MDGDGDERRREVEVATVARSLCALGCEPRLTGDGAHPCARCDAGEDPTFRREARAAIRALDALRGGTITVDGDGAPVASASCGGLSGG